MKARTRERLAREREEAGKRHGMRFLQADNALGKARKGAREALEAIKGVEFDEEEVQLLAAENEALQAMSRLVDSALTRDAGTDWDAELSKLEERGQWG